MTDFILYAATLVNVITFFAFGLDKRRARKRQRRIPEATLLWLSWATGLIGGWVAMSVFRHKTVKSSFRIKMVLVSLGNLLWAVIWFLTR